MNLIRHIERQREWALRTFGPNWSAEGNLKHIRKECDEVEVDPSQLSEWVDIIILAIQGAFRAGFSPAEIAYGIEFKQRVNEARNWPDWRTADHTKPIEHVRDEEPAEGGAIWADISRDDLAGFVESFGCSFAPDCACREPAEPSAEGYQPSGSGSSPDASPSGMSSAMKRLSDARRVATSAARELRDTLDSVCQHGTPQGEYCRGCRMPARVYREHLRQQERRAEPESPAICHHHRLTQRCPICNPPRHGYSVGGIVPAHGGPSCGFRAPTERKRFLVDPPRGSGAERREFDTMQEAEDYAGIECPARTRIVDRQPEASAVPARPVKRWLVDPPVNWTLYPRREFHMLERAESYLYRCPLGTLLIDRHQPN